MLGVRAPLASADLGSRIPGLSPDLARYASWQEVAPHYSPHLKLTTGSE